MTKNNSIVAQWPTRYAARFQSRRFTANQVAIVLTALNWFGRPSRLVLSVGIIFAALGVGIGFATVLRYPSSWPAYALAPLLVVVVGTMLGALPSPRMREMYEEGSETKMLVKDGQLSVDFNGHGFRYRTEEVVRVRRFGSLSAIETKNFNFLVVPTKWLPHYADSSQSVA